MRNFDYSKYDTYLWDNEIIYLVRQIYKINGKEKLYINSKPNELEKLVVSCKIESIYSSNSIEGVVTTYSRLKKIVKENIAPQNRSEEEIAGYKDVFNIILESNDAIKINMNEILGLHKIIYSYEANSFGGKIKSAQNYITSNTPNGREILFTPPDPFDSKEALDKICKEFNVSLSENKVEPLILICIFIHDFLCIHPFNDGNGRMSRLLTSLLLFKTGFSIPKYISLEGKIEKTKDMYYEALKKSGEGWHEEKEEVIYFIKYLLKTILSAYNDFEEKCELITNDNSKLDTIIKVMESKVGYFNKSDIIKELPNVSVSSVELALRKELKEDKIIKEGIGKSTKYRKK